MHGTAHQDRQAMKKTTLSAPTDEAPLAHRMRPRKLDEIVGQEGLIGDGGRLHALLAADRMPSLLLWGPPGSGKTTLSRLIAERLALRFVEITAVFSGVAELRKIFTTARAEYTDAAGSTLLFVDEIHRFNRAQQDSFLPYVEDGTITLIGATTENPSFYLNSALLSRLTLLQLSRLDEAALAQLLDRAEGVLGPLPLAAAAREDLLRLADGDGRMLFNLAEELAAASHDATTATIIATPQELRRRLARRAPIYDRAGDGHYDLISALHKSVRASDVDAALYYFARMLDGGEDPLYLARRLIRMAVEDIGLADPQALVQAQEAMQAYRFLGSPEGELALVQAVIFLATAPKSNAVYKAAGAAFKAAKRHGSLSPPAAIVNAPTALMAAIGRGAGYRYDHDEDEAFSGQNCFPDGLPRQCFYDPPQRGFEREIAKRLAYWAKLRHQRSEE